MRAEFGDAAAAALAAALPRDEQAEQIERVARDPSEPLN